MKRLTLLLVILCCTPLACFGQALVLTEIEQLQGKIWHLQQEVAAQKTSLGQLQQQVNRLAARHDEEQGQQEAHLAALIQKITSQQTGLTEMEDRLHGLEEMTADLAGTIGEQSTALQQHIENAGDLTSSLQALGAEFTAARTRSDQALDEIREQLIETRARIDTLRDRRDDLIEKLLPWIAGTVLGVAALLTIGLVVRGRQMKNRPRGRRLDHEL